VVLSCTRARRQLLNSVPQRQPASAGHNPLGRIGLSPAAGATSSQRSRRVHYLVGEDIDDPGAQYGTNCRTQLARRVCGAYKRGRYFHMTLHPQHTSAGPTDCKCSTRSSPSCAGIRAYGTRRGRNARAIGWKPAPPARICASNRASGRTMPAASAKDRLDALTRRHTQFLWPAGHWTRPKPPQWTLSRHSVRPTAKQIGMFACCRIYPAPPRCWRSGVHADCLTGC
jgi:hypothetical protein